MNVKKFPQMDRAKYHVMNGYLSETLAFPTIVSPWKRIQAPNQVQDKVTSGKASQNKFVKEKEIVSELLINAAHPRIRGIEEARC